MDGPAHVTPLLWLGGTLCLHMPQGRIDVAAAGLCGLPTRLFGPPTQLRAPQRYWLIENRASFERQALAAHDHAWLQRLQARTDLPTTLRALCTALQAQGHKAEQEFWL